MKCIVFLIAILGLASVPAIAGTEEYNLVPKDSIRDYCAFNKVRVLDLRATKDDFGYIKTGAFNSTQTLHSKNPEQMLQRFVERTCLQAQTKDDNTLLVVLQNFRITDRATGNELGTFYARIACYLGKDNQYQPILSIDSLFETTSSLDVTSGLIKIVNTKMTTWVIQAAKSHYTFNDSLIPEKEILDFYQQKTGYPIYNEAPKEGVYLTEEDFLNNRPEVSELLCAHDEGSIVYRVYKKNEKGKFKVRIHDEPWFAVYSKGKWYKKTSLGACKMEYSNNEFYFPEVGIGKRANDVTATTIMFGVVGGLIAGGSQGTGKVLYNMRYVPGTNNGKPVSRLM